LENHAVSKSDVLLTFGHPMSDHLAGLHIKKELGLPWIAHFSDPWVDNPFRHPASRVACRRMEAEVISRADRVVFTSRQTVDLVMRKYPVEWKNKVVVIPHAYDPELYPSHGTPGPELTIRSLGFLSERRSPKIFLEALAILHRTRPGVLTDVRVELIGRITGRESWSSFEQALPPRLLRVRPPIDYLTSLKLMRESDLLLLIDAPLGKGIFLPSKLVDYLGADRPIFGITPAGAVEGILEAAGQRTVRPVDARSVAVQLNRTLEELHASSHRSLNAADLREKYSARCVVPMLDTLVEELMTNR
jgi:glycosyltransferase involved in cell wall biosynthesis